MSMSTVAGGSSSHGTWNEKIKYDLFISFRGEDTRSNFTSHLHHALCRAKVRAFIDEDDLEKGNEISPTLVKAIEESKLCLVVLSEDYASSRWCLEELAHILRCKKMDGQAQVLPIFYKVDPSNVRKQQGSYAVAFAKLEKRFEDKKLRAWREALIRVADLSGWASNEFRSESKLIDTIVDVVIKKLNDMSVARNDFQGLVGITRHIEEIESLLHIGSLEVRAVGMWGVGGIGKTTLARVVFDQLSSQFEACSFLENVREESQKNAPYHLKNKLFSELLETESHHRITQFVKDRLRRKKVLIVFDDVDDPQQLENLFSNSWFGPGSRVIITSRDRQVLRNIGTDEIYEVGELNLDDALELFSLHAFKRNSPAVDKEVLLSKRVVNHTGGIPLALIVVGRHLFSKSIKEWKSTLAKLQKIPDKKIHSVLRISYDSLDDTEKDIFLDIACFFKGENRELAEKILDGCGLFATAGIRVLIDKALITVSEYTSKMQMHDLIQMMAFEVVRLQSSDQDPRKGSRLWIADDIYHALKNDRGIETIEGISLDTSNFDREISLLSTTFLKMCKLRLLKISGSKLCFPHGPPAFPDTLRYLSWQAYPLKSFSTNFTTEMLVALDMRGSQLEKLWEGSPHLDKLKFIDLSGSRCLTQVPDLSKAPNLKRASFEFCSSLIEVPSYFQHLKKLKELYLIGCPSLRKLSGIPKNLKILKVLTERLHHENEYKSCATCRNNVYTWFPSLDLSSKLERFPKIMEPMEFIETLKLEFVAIKELPPSIRKLIGLKQLSLKFCQNLEFLPDSIQNLSSLRKLSIYFCQKLESLPVLPSSLPVLDAVCCTSLKMVSSSIPLVNQNWDDLYNKGYKREKCRFLGCKMLDENARKVLMDEALFRTLRFATLLHKYGPDRCTALLEIQKICWPGSEIPRWFKHESEDCSISISLPHPDEWYNSSYLGIVSCIVVEYNDLSTVRPPSLELHCDSVYTFPNGDSWRQWGKMYLHLSSSDYRACAFNGCYSTDFCRKNIYDSMNNSEYVYVLMEIRDTYGEFLKSNNGKLDANGNKFPRTARVGFHYLKRGKYFKAKEGISAENGSGFTRTATASFSFKFCKEDRRFAKINKCGVHFLYAEEAGRFGYVEPIEFESNGGEAVYSDQEEDDGRESESSGGESLYPESDQEEDDSKESESSGSESIRSKSEQEEDYGGEPESSGSERIRSKSEQEEDVEEDNGEKFESRGREAICSESNQEEDDEPLRFIGCWSGFRWLLERFCLFRSGVCWSD